MSPNRPSPSLPTGTRVAVTGGARGIGLAVATRFSEAGAFVTVIDKDLHAAESACASLPDSDAAGVDVSDPAAVEDFFASSPHPYQVVVANAGIGARKADVIDIADAEWARIVAVNLSGTFFTIRSAAARMRRDNVAGKIIVTASIAGLTAEAGGAAYCASKWGVIGLLKSAALELAAHGILVNGVCPGDVDTTLFDEFGLDDDDLYHGPLGRMADTDEIAGAYVWLASDDARYVVGETLVIDGGLSVSALSH